jgi:GH25 family lysozyme M1 (1,4-beta-N-acetylmuramidase)
VSPPGRPRRTAPQRRAVAIAATLALAGGTLALGGTSAIAGTTAQHASSHPKVSWARTVTGRSVQVTQPSSVSATPVHPEKITHPRLDFMGSTVARHFHGRSAVKLSGVTPGGVTPGGSTPSTVPQLPGIDISAYQGNINWGNVAPYIDFVYAKATEGTYYTNPYFYNQYEGPYNAGLIRGAYHFAIPNNSAGKTQADYFIAHGGGWSGDGKTLPGALDIEYNPYGQECYNLTHSQMVSWIRAFVNEYAYREHAYPTIYSTTDWWTTCTGNYGGFGSYDPLWIANYTASHGGTLPSGWGFYTFWQYADHGSLPGDQDVFNGAYTQLRTLASRG